MPSSITVPIATLVALPGKPAEWDKSCDPWFPATISQPDELFPITELAKAANRPEDAVLQARRVGDSLVICWSVARGAASQRRMARLSIHQAVLAGSEIAKRAISAPSPEFEGRAALVCMCDGNGTSVRRTLDLLLGMAVAAGEFARTQPIRLAFAVRATDPVDLMGLAIACAAVARPTEGALFCRQVPRAPEGPAVVAAYPQFLVVTSGPLPDVRGFTKVPLRPASSPVLRPVAVLPNDALVARLVSAQWQEGILDGQGAPAPASSAPATPPAAAPAPAPAVPAKAMTEAELLAAVEEAGRAEAQGQSGPAKALLVRLGFDRSLLPKLEQLVARPK